MGGRRGGTNRRRGTAASTAALLLAVSLGACRDVPAPQVRRAAELVASSSGASFAAAVVSPDEVCRDGATAVVDGGGVHVGSIEWEGTLDAADLDGGDGAVAGPPSSPQVASLGGGRLLAATVRTATTPEGATERRVTLHGSDDCGATWGPHSSIDLTGLTDEEPCTTVGTRLHVDPFRGVAHLAVGCGRSDGTAGAARLFRFAPDAVEWERSPALLPVRDGDAVALTTTRSGALWVLTCAGGQATVHRSVDGGTTFERAAVGDDGDCDGPAGVTISRAAADAVRLAYPSPRPPAAGGAVTKAPTVFSARRAFASYQEKKKKAAGAGALTVLGDSLLTTSDPAASVAGMAFIDADDVVTSDTATRHDSVFSWVEVDARGRLRPRVAPVIGAFGYGEARDADSAPGAAVPRGPRPGSVTVSAAGAFCKDGTTHFVPAWSVPGDGDGGSIRAAAVTIDRPCGAEVSPSPTTTTTAPDDTADAGVEDEVTEDSTDTTIGPLPPATTVPPSIPPNFSVPEVLTTPTTAGGTDPTAAEDAATTATTGSTTSTSTSTSSTTSTTSTTTTTLPPSQLSSITVVVNDCTVSKTATGGFESVCPGSATFKFTDGSGLAGVKWSVNGVLRYDCQVEENYTFAQPTFDVAPRETAITKNFTLRFAGKDPNTNGNLLSTAKVLSGRTISNTDDFAGTSCAPIR